MRPPVKTLAPLAAVAAALAIAGCGGDDTDDAGPAGIVPAEAPVYVEVLVQPEGEAADDAEAALSKVSGSDDPGGDIVALLERQSSADGGRFNFEEDIEPWLGERVGFYPSSLAGETDATLVIETTDAEAALESIREQEDAKGNEKEYEGHTFETDADGDAFGLVDDFLVFGPPAGFKQVVDAAEGGETLGDTDQFSDSIEDLPDDRLVTLFALPSSFLEGIPDDEIDPQGRRLLLRALGEAGDQPILGDITASAEAITLELSAGGGGVETAQSKLLGQVPSDSWLALAFADIGKAVENGLSQVDDSNVGLDSATVRREIRRSTGIDLEQDVARALGDAAVFVTGTSEQSLGGALVVESKNADASAQLLTKVQGLIESGVAGEFEVEPLASTDGAQGFQLTEPGQGQGSATTDPSGATTPPEVGLTQPITVLQRDDRIIAGYGGEAINQALTAQGAEPLADSAEFKSATEAMGELGIDAFLSFGPALELAESAGATEAPGYEQAKPYLDALSFLALATGSEEERGIARFTVGLD